MHIALYRKYRPHTMAEIIGQDHITDTLKRSLEAKKYAHAYLLTGPRGVGKTSIARILAHEINGLAYDDESTHLDIIEIDGASNRRIDEMRNIRDSAKTAPAVAKYKIYIIDEVQMLTKEAFNALLKTLEEPPAHVIFILATTDAQKVPDTIISRSQHYSFRLVPTNILAKKLTDIAKKEGIDITPDAINVIAERGSGSFRDSISLLEQVSHLPQPISEDTLTSTLGVASVSMIELIAKSVNNGDIETLRNSLSQAEHQGVHSDYFAKQLCIELQKLAVNSKSTLLLTCAAELLALTAQKGISF